MTGHFSICFIDVRLLLATCQIGSFRTFYSRRKELFIEQKDLNLCLKCENISRSKSIISGFCRYICIFDVRSKDRTNYKNEICNKITGIHIVFFLIIIKFWKNYEQNKHSYVNVNCQDGTARCTDTILNSWRFFQSSSLSKH